MKLEYDIIIAGAGLAGLYLASILQSRGQDYLLLEARNRTGGRVLTENGHDLGPSWFWPNQPRIASLIQKFQLQPRPQHQAGDLIYDNGSGVQRLPNQSQEPWMRIQGGISALVNALEQAIPRERMLLESPITRVSIDQSETPLALSNELGMALRCRRLVSTLPPRLLANTIEFTPDLPAFQRKTLSDIPTWMAGHAKAVIVYSRPFWINAGLSGDAFSQRGPLGEIHDASTPEHAALFGFFAWDFSKRKGFSEFDLKRAVTEQLTELFGPEAASPLGVVIKDWTGDKLTATSADESMLRYHPRYGLDDISLFDGNVILAGSETSPEYGGFLEGALASAERAYAAL